MNFIFLHGCAPTYSTDEEMIEGVARLCKKEYEVDVAAKISGSTLCVQMPIKGLFDLKTMQISQEALKKVEGVMLSVSRVSLSGNKKIDFYVVITTDEDVPGAEVKLVRYVKDLRRFVYGDVSRGEFSKRMAIDINFNPQAIIDKYTGTFTITKINLSDFICQQASRRIIDEFQTNKNLNPRFKVAECKGELKNKVFVFDVDISREGLPMSELIHGKSWHEDVLLLCGQITSHVIWVYSYDDFDKIRINNKFDSKVLEIGKEEINNYRNKKSKIE